MRCKGCGVHVWGPPIGGVLWGNAHTPSHTLHTVRNRHHTHNHYRRPVGARLPAPNGEHMSDEEKPDALLFDDKPAAPVIDPKVRAMIDEAREAAGEPAVTVRQAARALGLTREHVYARIRSGTIRAIDGPAGKGQGTVRLVPLSEIERLVVEQGPRAHGEVKPTPADSRPMLQLERVTQRLESTRAVLTDAVESIADPPEVPLEDAGAGWWGRRKREKERAAHLEAALREAQSALREAQASLRAAHAAAEAGEGDAPSH